jgi:hypothetical protein
VNRRRKVVATVIAVGLAAALVLSAVLAAEASNGGDRKGPGERSHPRIEAVERCLRERGVDVPDRSKWRRGERPRPPAELRREVRDALKACAMAAGRGKQELRHPGRHGFRHHGPNDLRRPWKERRDSVRSCLAGQGIDREWFRDHRPLDASERDHLRGIVRDCVDARRS